MKEYIIFSEKGISTELTGEGAIVLKVTDESGDILDDVTFDIPINPDEAVVLGHELINLAQMEVNRERKGERNE